jgi:DNA replication and repair protein RecF
LFLTSLKLENYRNIKSINLEFQEGKNLVIVQGKNAQGKTNLLEAISFLSIPQAFFKRSLASCLKEDEPYFNIEGTFASNDELSAFNEVFEGFNSTKKIRFFYDNQKGKFMFRNDVETDLKDYVGNLKTVIFTPEDIQLVSKSPQKRRRFIDRLLIQTNPDYFLNLSKFNKVLKNRNALLKNRSNEILLSSTDKLFAKNALEVYKARYEFLEFLRLNIENIYISLSDPSQKIEIKVNSIDHKNLNTEFILEKLNSLREKDFIYGHTNFGPHRDDFEILKSNQKISEYGSRGERRTAVLALKIAEIEYLKTKCILTPILLLDDVFSELDEKRRYNLMQISKKYQTIVTTVETDYFKNLKSDQFQLLKLEAGQLL